MLDIQTSIEVDKGQDVDFKDKTLISTIDNELKLLYLSGLDITEPADADHIFNGLVDYLKSMKNSGIIYSGEVSDFSSQDKKEFHLIIKRIEIGNKIIMKVFL